MKEKQHVEIFKEINNGGCWFICFGMMHKSAASPIIDTKKRVIGANDKVRVGFIGVGNRGTQLLHLFMEQPDCEV